MTDFLIERQKLLDRLNMAQENLRQALRDRSRAEDQVDYWGKQVNALTIVLNKDQDQAD